MSIAAVAEAGAKLVCISNEAWAIPGPRHTDPHFHALVSQISAFGNVLAESNGSLVVGKAFQRRSPQSTARDVQIMDNLDAELTKTRNRLRAKENELQRLTEEFETKVNEAKTNVEAANAELEALASQSRLQMRALNAAHADMERLKHAHTEERHRLRDEMVRAACDQLRRAEETFRLQQQIDELLLSNISAKAAAEPCVERECAICMASAPNMAFSCGHVAICENCSEAHTLVECPVCRHPGGPQLRVYLL